MERPWHALSADRACAHLGVRAASGLPEHEVQERLARHGPNRLMDTTRVRWPAVAARQVLDVLVLILFAAAAVSAAVGEWVDALAILGILLLNGVLGFVQEWKAERALAALRLMLVPRCTVVRDGVRREVDAETLVPGDVVILGSGARVPADLRLLETLDLHADEAALTGESVPVAKDTAPVAEEAPVAEQRSMAWMGTTATHGWGRGAVVATGMQSRFGRIAALTAGVDRDATPLQRRLGRLGVQLGIAAALVATAVALLGAWKGRPPLEMFLTGVALAVAVVPEGLPAVVTITLALGLRAMARRNALVRRLRSAEALGAATVILTDKTGTLTRNEMTVTRIWLPGAGDIEVTGAGYAPEGEFRRDGDPVPPGDVAGLRELLETGSMCNHGELARVEAEWVPRGSPTEVALLTAARKAGVDTAGRAPAGELSFSSARKRMTLLERTREGLLAHVKGAPEVVMERCGHALRDGAPRPLEAAERAGIVRTARQWADGGLRVLALARRALPRDAPRDAASVERDLVLLGLVGLLDPARPEVPAAIALARSAGISVMVVTGDAAGTASSVARAVGLPLARVVRGRELDALEDAALRVALSEGATLFARTTPEQKLRLVEVLRGAGETVAMTGDGVNDAPALKRADIGIAMGQRGTDVARGAADILLLDDNFATIVAAVEEGRRQYDNLRKFVRYLLSSNTAEVLALLGNVALGGPLILLPAQILWINLVTDSVTAAALGLEPAEPGVMERTPRAARPPILGAGSAGVILLLGAYMGGVALLLFRGALDAGRSEAEARTLALLALIAAEQMNVFNFRSLRCPLHRLGFLSNRALLLGWVAVALLTVAAVYAPGLRELLRLAPPRLSDWGVVLAAALPVLVAGEVWKAFAARR